MAKVLFYTATAEKFAALEAKNENALYFITDTGELYKGAVRYTFPVQQVTEFPESGDSGVLYVNTDTKEIKLWNGNEWVDALPPTITDIHGVVTDTQIPTAKAVQDYVSNLADYTAFAVFPTDFEIPAGAVAEMTEDVQTKLAEVYGDWVLSESLETAIPAQMTYMFNLYTINQDFDKSNIVVDWGDGTRSVVKNGDYLRIHPVNANYGSSSIVMSHTYNTSGKYIVKIYGNDYYSIRHRISQGTSGAEADFAGTYNLVCECFSASLPLASHLKNASSMFYGGHRLLKVAATPYGFVLKNITGCSSMFFDCENLIIATGVNPAESSTTCYNTMFAQCYNLRECDLTFNPILGGKDYGLREVFGECRKLTRNVEDFFPQAFLTREISELTTFMNCKNLTGTVPAKYLWEDTNIKWKLSESYDSDGSNKHGMFYRCSDGIRAQVPLSWGGTNADIVIPTGSTGSEATWDTIE